MYVSFKIDLDFLLPNWVSYMYLKYVLELVSILLIYLLFADIFLVHLANLFLLYSQHGILSYKLYQLINLCNDLSKKPVNA